MATNCHSLKATLLDFLASSIEITASRECCVLTLPHKTLDDRFASVFVQEKMPGFYVVDDGGKTSAELFAQGIHLTDVRADVLEELAKRFGATFVQGTFRVGCQADKLNEAIVSIGQCATLATWYVLGHKPRFDEEPILHRIEAGMRAWKAPYEYELRSHYRAVGQKTEHVIDFVTFPRSTVPHSPIGVKVVRPSDNPLEQARGYGFMAYDLANTPFDWPRLAVVTRADEWTQTALDLIYASATAVIAIDTGKEETVEQSLPQKLSEIAA